MPDGQLRYTPGFHPASLNNPLPQQNSGRTLAPAACVNPFFHLGQIRDRHIQNPFAALKMEHNLLMNFFRFSTMEKRTKSFLLSSFDSLRNPPAAGQPHMPGPVRERKNGWLAADVIGYRQDKGSVKDSQTPTFAMVELFIDDWRSEAFNFSRFTENDYITRKSGKILNLKRCPANIARTC